MISETIVQNIKDVISETIERNIKDVISDTIVRNTGLPTKDDTIETIV